MNSKVVETLAREFSKEITEWLGVATMRKVILENESHKGTSYEDCCATGNYCDSNMAMNEAFERVLGREFNFSYLEDGTETPEQLKKHEEDTDLWNSAWDMAKKNKYWIK